jgi:succinate-semialdehyde dehydrogenase/glutarate-semialdehyde dehydrogenase
MTATYDADLQLFINGAWRSGEGREARPVYNPATAATIAELPVATAADLDEALAAAARGWPVWRAKTPDERAALMRKAAGLIRERADHIATLLTLEQGKPIAEARGEVLSASSLLEYFAEQGKRIEGRVVQRPAGQRAMVLKQPVGPVAAFSPWNFPVNLMIKKVAPALAAGCVVIAKAPEETPGCTSAIMRCLADAGIPGDVVQLVYGNPDMISRHLLGSEVIRKVSFTGSTAVGKHLMKLAADRVQRITMELGGHAPVLVFDDCDLETTLDRVVTQKFRNAGQVCVSPTRFYVQDGIYDAFVKGFGERTARVKIGSGLDAGPDGAARQCAPRPGAGGDDCRCDCKGRAGDCGRRRDGRGLFLPADGAGRRSARRRCDEQRTLWPDGADPAVRDRRRRARTGEPAALWPGSLRLHRKRPPHQPRRRWHRKRHGGNQQLRHLGQ